MGKSGFEISKSEIVFIICEAICILFYGLFTEFDDYNTPKIKAENEHKADEIAWTRYPSF
jgi:hypothetical protein